VRESYLAPTLFVGKDGKGRNFAARSAGSGDGNQPNPVRFLGWVLNDALAEIEKGRGQLFKVGLRRLVFQLHDFSRIDHGPAAQRDDLVRFVEIKRLHSVHHHLDLRLGIGNDRYVDVGSLRKVAANNIHVAEMLQRRIGDDDGGGRWELTDIFHRVHVEINLIRNSEPHMGLCPPSHTFDIEVVIDIYVIGGAVAAAGAASEGEGGHEIVVDASHGAD